MWLLDWGGRSHKTMTVELCLKAFEEGGPDELILTALKTATILGAPVEMFRCRATEFFRQPQPGNTSGRFARRSRYRRCA